MKSRITLGIASMVIALTAAVTLAIIIPMYLWTTTTGVAAALLVLSIALPGILPSPAQVNRDTDAGRIALIGPLASLYAWLFVVGCVGFALSMNDEARLSWVSDCVWIGSLVASVLILKASSETIASAALQNDVVGEKSNVWRAKLEVLAMRATNDETRASLRNLAEKIRYSASDSRRAPAPQNEAIRSLIASLEPALANNEDLPESIKSLELLLEEREQYLRTSKSFA